MKRWTFAWLGCWMVFLALSISAGHATAQPAPDEAGETRVTATPAIQIGGEIVISALDNRKFLPDVAYNWKHHEYLVVWHNFWGGNRDVYAWRVAEDGRLLSWFAVSAGAKDRVQPAVAYDGVNDRYLVVWAFDYQGNGSDWDIYGRFIPWQGPDDQNLKEFVVCDWQSSQWNPVVAYAHSAQEFMVVWTNTSASIPAYISGRRVYANGSGFPATGSDITISHTTLNRINPAIAYDLKRNEYLVVWEDVATSRDIWALRMTANATPLGGGEFGVAGWPDNEERPAVAACAKLDQYLVAWQSDVGAGNYDVYARFVTGDGTVDGAPLHVDGTTSPEEEVDVSCDFAETYYLAAWQARYTNLKYGIATRVVHADHSMENGFDLVAPGGSRSRTNPVVAAAHSNLLVVWEHRRDGTSFQDIHGKLLHGSLLYLPLVIR